MKERHVIITNIVRRRRPPGSRPQKIPFGFNEADPRCIEFKKCVKDTIRTLYDMGFRHFISGGAMGMDMFAAEAVVELRAEYPEIILEMVSPFDDQAVKWSPKLRARHDRLFAQADVTTATGHAYTKSALFRRNHYHVDNADLLLAAYDGQPGGTAMTCALAQQYHVPVIKIKPSSC